MTYHDLSDYFSRDGAICCIAAVKVTVKQIK